MDILCLLRDTSYYYLTKYFYNKFNNSDIIISITYYNYKKIVLEILNNNNIIGIDTYLNNNCNLIIPINIKYLLLWSDNNSIYINFKINYNLLFLLIDGKYNSSIYVKTLKNLNSLQCLILQNYVIYKCNKLANTIKHIHIIGGIEHTRIHIKYIKYVQIPNHVLDLYAAIEYLNSI